MVIYAWPKWFYIVIVHIRNFEQEICLPLLKCGTKDASCASNIRDTHTDAEMATERGLLIHVSTRILVGIKNHVADRPYLGVSVAFLMFPIPPYMHRHL